MPGTRVSNNLTKIEFCVDCVLPVGAARAAPGTKMPKPRWGERSWRPAWRVSKAAQISTSCSTSRNQQGSRANRDAPLNRGQKSCGKRRRSRCNIFHFAARGGCTIAASCMTCKGPLTQCHGGKSSTTCLTPDDTIDSRRTTRQVRGGHGAMRQLGVRYGGQTVG